MKHIHQIIWMCFIVWVGFVLYFAWHPKIFAFDTPFLLAKLITWITFIAFTTYTYYCSSKENFVKSMKKMATMKWGWQVGIDLYIGLFMFLWVIYLHSNSLLVVLYWILPTIIFGNISTLLYLSIYFDSIVAKFFY